VPGCLPPCLPPRLPHSLALATLAWLPACQVDLIGHSAGGWLGRAFIGQEQYKGSTDSSYDEPHEAVRSLITLGSPHTPPPPEKVRGGLSKGFGSCESTCSLHWARRTRRRCRRRRAVRGLQWVWVGYLIALGSLHVLPWPENVLRGMCEGLGGCGRNC
jgi:hypothetical protein